MNLFVVICLGHLLKLVQVISDIYNSTNPLNLANSVISHSKLMFNPQYPHCQLSPIVALPPFPQGAVKATWEVQHMIS